MALKDVFKVSRKTFFNPSLWFGYESFVAMNHGIWNIIKSLFIRQAPAHKENFEEAVQRLQLTDTDLHEARKNYYAFAIFFLVLGLIAFLYGLYLLLHHHTLSGLLLAFISAALFFSQAFKYHFWYFQIKQRKLGCTYQEWRHGSRNTKQ